jgi:predicted RNA binding protein YcfA (HicA-like mRNA interferase family)
LGKLRNLSGSEVCRILSKHGFVQVRQKGSHAIMQKAIENSTITVPVPLHTEMRIGTLQSIIRQSGIARLEFETN